MANADTYTSSFEIAETTTSQPEFSKASSARAVMRFIERRLKVIIGVTLVVLALTTVACFVLPPRYIAETVVLLGASHDGVASTDPVTPDAPVSPEIVRSELDVVTSRAVIDAVIARLHLDKDPEFNPPKGIFDFGSSSDPARKANAIAARVFKRLTVDNDGRSFGIHITFASKDPAKAALIANTFADQYLQQGLIAKAKVTQNAAQWLDSRMAGLRDKATQSEQAVADYRTQHNLIAVSTQMPTAGDSLPVDQTVAGQQLSQLNNDLITAKTNTSLAEAKLRAVQAGASGGGATDILSSPLIQSLRKQESDLQQSVADLQTRFGPKYPLLAATRVQLSQVQQKIAEESQKIVQGVSADASAARSNEGAIQANLNRLEDQASEEQAERVKLNELQRQADADNTIYQQFLAKSSQVAQQATLQIPSASIVSVAKPPLTAAFPKKPIMLAAGLIMGGLLGFFIAYALEYMDPTFRSMEQVEHRTRTHVVGLIPDLRQTAKTSPENYVLERPNSQFTEALRNAWADITSQNKRGAVRSVTITSSTKGEGKSTFSMALARMLASGDQRVLLVDADMRFPRVGQALGVQTRNGGLNAYLTGHKTLEEVAQPDTKLKNLMILPAEKGAPNIQEMLGNDRLADLIRSGVEHFDVIIFDTPPAAAVADAASISRLTDVTVFVTQWGKVSETEVNRAMRQLKSAGGRINGVALSQVKISEYQKYVDGFNPNLYNDYFVN